MNNNPIKTICVLGLGYIGLPTASLFANNGIKVIGVDVNHEILQILNSGNIHIDEPNLREVVKAAIGNGNLIIQAQPGLVEAFIIAVPTPIYADKRADMRAVTSATEAIVPYLRRGNLVILESTSPPRTTVDLVLPILERSGLKAGQDFMLAYSPERVLPGQILKELVENARVVGGIDEASAQAAETLYRRFVHGEIVRTDATTAEMVKLMENTYRDVNIAIANEFSRLGKRFGVDIWEAIGIANKHPRVKILQPGPGVGGHCISVDPWFFVDSAPDLSKLILAARQVNDSQPVFVLEMIGETLGNLEGRKIALLGLTFKADVDDLRESPAIEVAHLLTQSGAIVKAYEPNKSNGPIAGIETAPELSSALKDAEAIVVLVNHKQFLSFTPEMLRSLTPASFIFDTVNLLDQDAWQESGFSICKLGNGKRLLFPTEV